MDVFSILNYCFWTPILAWIGLYFWFYRVSYPTYFKSQMRKGRKWAFIPVWKGFWTPCDVLFSLIMSVLSALPAIWVIHNWTDLDWTYGFVVTPVFLVVGFILCRVAKAKTAKLYQSAYFLEYRKVRYKYEVKGNFRNEGDVQNQTVWSYTKKLKNAEAHGRLWKYVNAMAKTKKIPPDIYAETMYV